MDFTMTRMPKLRDVQHQGGFFGEILNRVRTQMIPFQWDALNDRVEGGAKSHCIENFRIAAGLEHGEFYGMVFQDSDVAKWLEAVAYQLDTKPDAELEALADDTIDLIAKAQQPDGYLDTYFINTGLDKRWTNLRDCHELYCAGHLLEAAVAYYRATGKRKFLDVMIRYVDHIDSVFGREPGKKPGYPGHEEIELALCKLYDVEKDERFLKLASYFIDQRGQSPNYFVEEQKKLNREYFDNGCLGLSYGQHHAPVREQPTMEGHAVRALYLATGMADVAIRNQDQSLWDACMRLYKNVTTRRMYVTGGVGSTHVGEAFTFDYDLPNDTVYAETCASIALIFFCQRLLSVDLDGDYADTIERALYNTCLAGMSLDQKRFFYVNPLSVWPEASHKDPGKRHDLPERPKWFGCACCPPNVARLLSSIGIYQFASRDGEVDVHLYLNGEAHLDVGGRTADIRVETNYPSDGVVRVIAGKGDYALKLHLPAWCRAYTVARCGKAVQPKVERGYLVIEGPFDGDEIVLSMDMPARFVYANPLVREDVGKVAVMRGPVVYCMEEADNGKNLHLIRLAKDAALTERYEPDLLEGTIAILTKGTTVEWDTQELYPEEEAWTEVEKDVKLIPYYKWANRGENEMEVWLRK